MDKIQFIQPMMMTRTPSTPPSPDPLDKHTFSTQLQRALEQVNQTQKEADVLLNQLASGEVEDIHQVMLAQQKASLSMELTLQVRNKVVESYQEIMRMQM